MTRELAKKATRLFQHHRKNKGGGFTLLEILTVIAIIGTLTLISMPIYRQIKPTLALSSVTRDIVSDLRYTQQLAVTEQNNYSVLFDQVFNQYTIIKTETNEIIKEQNLNSGISIYSTSGFSTSTVTFNVTGAALESGTITIINSNNATTTISVKPSGYVKIE